jgi:glycerol-3-phosphate acyltransferase PlsY
VVGVWRYVSLGSILGAASLPVMLWRLYPAAEGPPRVVTYGALLVAALIIVKHKDNIRRLVAGTENRLGKKKLTGGG